MAFRRRYAYRRPVYRSYRPVYRRFARRRRY